MFWLIPRRVRSSLWVSASLRAFNFETHCAVVLPSYKRQNFSKEKLSQLNSILLSLLDS
jgi:hypothetical protein